ncbi:MAG: hypothetical protein A2857_02485 [Candidatus Levybacteria bacterium RIFCSPHIGHO2_01_FULL_36_15]|nr:MAG: hypothetical protein A2857_02485 [Candidatus Levybacteria bacterium RIFCSPHIGHO2_01_FULL_36_15]OGH38627.1 MAG: hypothetical protein A2905_05375 [Candidatus Levybacteria bacterium RIFCSPLOWO2_01_FULL_36_10]
MTGIIKQKGVIYLSKDKLDVYINNSQRILRLLFNNDIVKDLEVIDKEKFYVLIKAFIETNKIPPSEAVIILSRDLIFERDLPTQETEGPQGWEEIQKYLDTVPFETIGIKLLKQEKTTKVIATNRDFYRVIKEGFEKQGFTVNIIIPVLVLGTNNRLETTTSLDLETGKFILRKLDSIKMNSMPINENYTQEKEENKNSPIENKRLLAMLIILGILIIILIFMYLTNISPQKSPKQRINIPSQTRISTTKAPAIPLNEEQISTGTPGGILKNDLNIKILNGSTSATLTEKVKLQLGKQGFNNIEIETNTSINTSKTLIVFSDKISKETKDQITNAVVTIFPNISVQENNNLKPDVIITIGKN